MFHMSGAWAKGCSLDPKADIGEVQGCLLDDDDADRNDYT